MDEDLDKLQEAFPEIDRRTLHDRYREFSEECYSAGWMSLDDYLIYTFGKWIGREDPSEVLD